MKAPDHHSSASQTFADYRPLIALVGTAALVASAKRWIYGPGESPASWMLDFMGFFLVTFALVKLFNLTQFADGFQRYDLLARRVRAYALAYPFIELALGLGYLAHWHLTFISSATIIVLGFGALGVISALRRGLDINCACMGNVLKVPLSTVALSEDLGMVAMAAFLLARVV